MKAGTSSSSPGEVETTAPREPQPVFCFGSLEFRPEAGELTNLGIPRRLENQPAKILAYLIEHRDRVVSRDELIQLLWPDQAHGDFDHRLDKGIAKLRFALNESAAKAKYVETLRGRGFRFVAEVTVPIPPETEDSAASAPSPAEQSDPGESQKRRLLRRSVVPLALAASVLLGILPWFMSRKGHQEVAARGTPAVVILGLRPVGDLTDENWISQGAEAWLSEDLESNHHVRVVSGFPVRELRSRLPADDIGGLSRDLLDQIRVRSGAEFVLFGTYKVDSQLDSQVWRVELAIQDTRRPQSVQRTSVTGAQSDGPSLLRHAQEQLLRKVGFGEIKESTATVFQSRLPSNPLAARLYTEGLLAMNRFDPVEASALLSKARELEPAHEGTHFFLAKAFNEMGDQKNAAREFDLISRSTRELSQRQHDEVWALQCEIAGDWTTAAKVYTQLAEEDPQAVQDLIEGASAFLVSGDGPSAVGLLERSQGLQPNEEAQAQMDLLRAQAHESMGNFNQQLADALRAEQNGDNTGRSALVARALVFEGSAKFALGDWSTADAFWQRSFDVFNRSGDQRGMAKVLYHQGRMLYAKSQLVMARRVMERSVALNKAVGDKASLADSISFLGKIILHSNADPNGEINTIMPLYRQSMELYRELGNVAGQGRVLGLIAEVETAQWRFASAFGKYREALELSKQASDRSAVANRLLDLGIVFWQMGQLHRAEDFYSQAVAGYLAIGQRDRAALSKNRLSGVLFEEDKIDQAIQLNTEALQTIQSIGYIDHGVLDHQARAEIERNPQQAEAFARESIETSTDLTDPRGVAVRYATLAETQLACGKVSEARASIDHAFGLGYAYENAGQGSHMLWVRGLVEQREGNVSLARSDLNHALKLARRFSSKPEEMEVRLALGDLDRALRPALASAELDELAIESARLGFLRVSRKAKERRTSQS